MMEQLPLRMRLRDSARYASYVVSGNEQAVDAVRAQDAPRVVWLWGRAGTGKTHLLQAACADSGERGAAAAYFDVASADSSAMLEGCESLDLVCLDGLEAVAGVPAWNAAMFRLHTLLLEGSGRLLVATTAPPAGIDFTLPDLRSRLLAAAVFQLRELDEPGQCAALRLRASVRGLELSEEVALYLVHRLPRDLPSLLGVLERLDVASLAAQRRLTIPFLKQVLSEP
jgi:DnaA family protein